MTSLTALVRVPAAAAGLLRLRDRAAGNPPLALAVVTATGYGFTRPDRVAQIPVGAQTA